MLRVLPDLGCLQTQPLGSAAVAEEIVMQEPCKAVAIISRNPIFYQ